MSRWPRIHRPIGVKWSINIEGETHVVCTFRKGPRTVRLRVCDWMPVDKTIEFFDGPPSELPLRYASVMECCGCLGWLESGDGTQPRRTHGFG